MRITTLESKHVLDLTINDAKDMCSRDAMATFRERKVLEGKKLYSKFEQAETIAINNKDKDDMKLAKLVSSHPSSPTTFAGMVMVKLEVLTLEGANEKKLRDEEQRLGF